MPPNKDNSNSVGDGMTASASNIPTDQTVDGKPLKKAETFLAEANHFLKAALKNLIRAKEDKDTYDSRNKMLNGILQNKASNKNPHKFRFSKISSFLYDYMTESLEKTEWKIYSAKECIEDSKKMMEEAKRDPTNCQSTEKAIKAARNAKKSAAAAAWNANTDSICWENYVY